MKYLRILITLTVIIAIGFSNLSADCGFKFRGKPKDECCTFMIYETGLMKLASGEKNQYGTYDLYALVMDLGLMRNLDKKNAIGGSFCLLSDEDFVHFGFRPRYKRWLSKDLSVDISAGVFFNKRETYNTRQTGGIILGSSFSIGELLSFDLLFHRYNYKSEFISYPSGEPVKDSHNTSLLYMGVTGRSYTGIVGQAVIIALAIAIAATWN